MNTSKNSVTVEKVLDSVSFKRFTKLFWFSFRDYKSSVPDTGVSDFGFFENVIFINAADSFSRWTLLKYRIRTYERSNHLAILWLNSLFNKGQ